MRTANALLDYRFGWRWLLPSIVGRKVKLYGFSIEEELFWHDTLGDVIWSFAPHETEVVIVNGFARPNSVDQVDSMHMQNAQLVCVISSRGQYGHWYRQLCQQFSMVREYGLLPSGNPRVVVPLSSSNNVIAALSLHRPGRKIAQLALVVARLLAMLGNFTLLRGCTLMIASRSAKLMPSSLLDSNLFTIIRSGKTSDYALYLGTADDNRKTVVLPVGKSPSAFILKVSVTTKASASLKNEASALSILADSVLSTSVPRVQQIILSSSYDVTICQEYRPRKRTSHSMLNCEVVRFLGQLMFLQHKLVPLSDWLKTSRAGSNRVKNDSSIVSGCCQSLVLKFCCIVPMEILHPGTVPGQAVDCLCLIGRIARRMAWLWEMHSIILLRLLYCCSVVLTLLKRCIAYCFLLTELFVKVVWN